MSGSLRSRCPAAPKARYAGEGRLDHGDYWYTATVEFTGAELAALRLGQVLASTPGETYGSRRSTTMSLDELVDRGPAHCE